MMLIPFKYDVCHRDGAQHKNADSEGLSRVSVDLWTAMEFSRGKECDEVIKNVQSSKNGWQGHESGCSGG